MKKIININLSGRVIPIEDAAYESLQDYIESLRRFFSQEEGRDEIINDIESRVAELMNDKVKKGAPAITEADMSDIINTMGRVEDFEQDEPMESTSASFAGSAAAGPETKTGSAPFVDVKTSRGRLYRDSSDKILGGVSSGIANYFGIDPAIVRILFVLLTFGAGMSILVYILLWIVVPARPLEPTLKKRLFRNPDDRILGGVAGGLAAYFNKDAWTIRLIFAAPLLLNIFFGILNGLFFAFHMDIFPNFVIGSFTGTFILTYIILWIILPEAKSPFEKMEMRGENVDVNRIRKNVQEEIESLKTKTQTFFKEEVRPSAENLAGRAREFAGTRGKTFATEMGQAVRPASRGIGRAVGILFKILLLAIGGFFAFMFFIALVALLFGGAGEFANDFILDGFRQKFLGWSSMLLLFGLPVVALLTWIIRRLMKVRTHNRYIGWTFGGLFVIGLVLASMFAFTMIRSFRTFAKVQETVPVTTSLNSLRVILTEPELETSGSFGFFNPPDDLRVDGDSLRVRDIKMRIEKSRDSFYHITLWRYSAGNNTNASRSRAQKIQYAVNLTDTVLNLNNYLVISNLEKYRGQKVMIVVHIPQGKTITFDQTTEHRLPVRVRETGGRYYWRNEHDLDWEYDDWFDWEPGVVYMMNANGELVDPLKPEEKNSGNGVYEYEERDNNNEVRDTLDIRVNDSTINRRAAEQEERQERSNRPRAASAPVPPHPTALLATPVFSMI